jgi:hypothetical protein
MVEEGYTTIFHPGEERVTFYKEGTFTIATSEPPVFKGYKKQSSKTVDGVSNTKHQKS